MFQNLISQTHFTRMLSKLVKSGSKCLIVSDLKLHFGTLSDGDLRKAF